MQVGLAGDDSAGCAETLYEPGIPNGVSIQLAIEVRAATGGRACQIETILH
jgi:hypothetical protein